MIEEIRKILSDDNIKEMACEYTLAEEEYQGFILGCNVLADEIEEQLKYCSIHNVSQQRELLSFMEYLSLYWDIYEVIDCTKHQQVIEQYKP